GRGRVGADREQGRGGDRGQRPRVVPWRGQPPRRTQAAGAGRQGRAEAAHRSAADRTLGAGRRGQFGGREGQQVTVSDASQKRPSLRTLLRSVANRRVSTMSYTRSVVVIAALAAPLAAADLAAVKRAEA